MQTTTTTTRAVCLNCQSDKLFEDDEGEVVCDSCGTIAQARQQIAATLEMDPTQQVNMRLKRRVARRPDQITKRVKTAEEIRAAEEAAAILRDRKQSELREFLHILLDVFMHKIGVLGMDENRVLAEGERIITGSASAQRALLLVALCFDCTSDEFLLGSDVTNFGNSGLIPLMMNGMCLERGPALYDMKSLPLRQVNWKAAAMRISICYARVLRMNWMDVWRAVYTVLFTLGGINGLECAHGFGLPSAVVACVVLVPNWQRKIFDLMDKYNLAEEMDRFSLVPLRGAFSRPSWNLLDRMETDARERAAHFARQNAGLGELDRPSNSFLQRILEDRVARPIDSSVATEYCDGHCLEHFFRNERAEAELAVPHFGLNIWLNLKWRFEQLRLDDVNRALVHLVDLTCAALDNGLGLQQERDSVRHKFIPAHIAPDRYFVKDEIQNLLAYLHTQTGAAAMDANVQQQDVVAAGALQAFTRDTRQLVDIGCQKLLVCARNAATIRQECAFLDCETTDEE